MAINLNDYKITKYPNLYKSNKKDKLGFKYLMWIKIDGKIYKKILGYSEKDKLTNKKANEILIKKRDDIQAGFIPSDSITLDKLFSLYFDTLDKTKKWTYQKKYRYELYIKPSLGKKKISKLLEKDISSLISKIKEDGLSPRTQKTVLEILKPLFKFAIRNKYLKENPSEYITVKIPNQKKVVTNATDLFINIHKGIITYFKDNPFYQALFLFGFTGRRKIEIFNLKWENIDFKNNYYWIEDTKNNDKQKYILPPYIKEQLLLINDDKKGLVFKSPISGEALDSVERQVKNLKKFVNINNLSFHYMRNILVSMLAEQKTEAIVLSGILGHKDVNTINKYLSINHFKSSQEGLKKIDEVIEIEVIEK